MLGNAFMNNVGNSHAAQSPLGQLIGGMTHTSGGQSGGSGIGGKLANQLVSNLFSSSNKPAAPQNYHGGPTQNVQNTGGFAGSMMGGVAHMFGGKPQVCCLGLQLWLGQKN
jgi:hypothetical protein